MVNPLTYPIVRALLALAAALAFAWLASGCASPTAPTPTPAPQAMPTPQLQLSFAPVCPLHAPLPSPLPLPPTELRKAGAGVVLGYWQIVDRSRTPTLTRYVELTFTRTAAGAYALCSWRTLESLPGV